MENQKPENVAFEGGDGLSMVVELPLGVAAATFNLEKAVCSHGLFMMAPNYWDSQSKTLQRPLRLSLDFDDPKYQTSLTVKISQPTDSSHSLFIEVFGTDSLSPLQCQALLDQVKRMLRLSEEDEKNVKEFQEICEEAKEKGFGRVFRSPTLFEDMVKCILLCNCQWSRTLSMARALCELQWEIQHQSSIVSSAKTDQFIPKTPAGKESKKKYGVKKCSRNLTNKFLEINSGVKEVMDSNGSCSQATSYVMDQCEPCRISIEGICWGSGIGNFPSPKELASLDETFLAKRCNLGYRAGRILKFAQNVVEGKIQLRALEEASRRNLNMTSYDELLEQLKGINGFGPYTSANVLMCMGFYHIIPTDSETIRHLRQVHAKHSTIETVQKEIEEIYGKYTPFQFLAYWSEVWQFYEEWFGKSSEMNPACYKLITAANMRPEKKGKSKKIKICIS